MQMQIEFDTESSKLRSKCQGIYTGCLVHNVQIGAINPYFPFRVHQSPEDGRTETQTSDQIAQHYVSGIGQGFWSMATNLAASQGLFRCSPVNGLRLVQILSHDAL